MKRGELKENSRRPLEQQQHTQPKHTKRQSAPLNFSLPAAHPQDEGLMSLLQEYFLKHNFTQTLMCFQRDCMKGFRHGINWQEATREELLGYFDQGNRQAFFTKFHLFVPLSMRIRHLGTLKLEFYVQLYFYLYQNHPHLGKKKVQDPSAKQFFISFLEGRGQSLTKYQEFLPLYAIVTLSKPQDNSIFKPLFTRDWPVELRKSLVQFLDHLYPSSKVPVLVTLYDRFLDSQPQRLDTNHSLASEIPLQIEQQIEAPPDEYDTPVEPVLLGQETDRREGSSVHRNEELVARIQELEDEKEKLIAYMESSKKKYQQLQSNYKDFSQATQNSLRECQSKWFSITQEFYKIASDLLEITQQYQKGTPPAQSTIVPKIASKLSKYKSFISMNMEELFSENVDFSLFERGDNDVSADFTRLSDHGRIQKIMQLDYFKIKKFLATQEEDESQRCAVLLFLKERILKTRGAFLKREAVMSLVHRDLFGLSPDIGPKVFDVLLASSNLSLVMCLMQLLNALSKDFYGRSYISTAYVISACIKLFQDTTYPEPIRNTILICLQSLSVRKGAQLLMINNDLVKIIITKLDKERETMLPQVMEYTCALLMNILLHKEGLAKSEQIRTEVLTTLINLMEAETPSVRSFVHGSLYPILSKQSYRQKAKEFGMEENIKFQLENCPAQSLQKQLRYLEERLQKEGDLEESGDESFEDENDQDDIIDEQLGDDYELGKPLFNQDISGEDILLKNYLLTGPDALFQVNTINSLVDESLKKRLQQSFFSRSQQGTAKPGASAAMRRNVSNNNSVYSTVSNQRIPMPEKAFRPNRPPMLSDLDASRNQILTNDLLDRQSDVIVNTPSQSRNRDRPLVETPQMNQSRQDPPNNQNSIAQSARNFDEPNQYEQAFGVRKMLVRTPPEK